MKPVTDIIFIILTNGLKSVITPDRFNMSVRFLNGTLIFIALCMTRYGIWKSMLLIIMTDHWFYANMLMRWAIALVISKTIGRQLKNILIFKDYWRKILPASIGLMEEIMDLKALHLMAIFLLMVLFFLIVLLNRIAWK